MAKKVKWTEEEDKILVQAIEANPHNRTQAFRKTAEKVNHSVKACSKRWYLVLSNPESKKYVGCMFASIGKHTNYSNRSVYRTMVHIAPTKTKIGIWAKIRGLLGL